MTNEPGRGKVCELTVLVQLIAMRIIVSRAFAAFASCALQKATGHFQKPREYRSVHIIPAKNDEIGLGTTK